MKKKILCLGAIGVAVLGLASCDKKEDPTPTPDPVVEPKGFVQSSSFDLYCGASATAGDYLIMNSTYEECVYEDNTLEMSTTLSFTSDVDNSTSIAITDVQAYGNNEKLYEKVYSSYDYFDMTKSTVMNDFNFTLGLGKKSFEFILVIPDGNSLADFKINFKINGVENTVRLELDSQASSTFTYVHNPLYNVKAMADAEASTTAVYGFVPSATGSLSNYAKYDWTNATDVAKYKQNRIDYVEANDAKLKALETEMFAAGKTIEEVARACSNLRNQNRMDAYKDDPDGLATLKARNLTKYGHEEGPLPDELYAKYGSWELVLEKSYSTNPGMDAICGVYDMYYYLY